MFKDISQENGKINWQYGMFETDVICNEECPIISKLII